MDLVIAVAVGIESDGVAADLDAVRRCRVLDAVRIKSVPAHQERILPFFDGGEIDGGVLRIDGHMIVNQNIAGQYAKIMIHGNRGIDDADAGAIGVYLRPPAARGELSESGGVKILHRGQRQMGRVDGRAVDKNAVGIGDNQMSARSAVQQSHDLRLGSARDLVHEDEAIGIQCQ